MDARTQFFAIIQGWNEGESASDLYDKILKWIMLFQYEIEAQDEVEDILDRMGSNDSIQDIVGDFVYGSCYQKIRAQFHM
jgi:hypothetical protein